MDTASRAASALTLSSLVDAGWRALLGRAVLKFEAATMQTLVAAWALRDASRSVVEMRPSLRSRACLGNLAHVFLEATPAVTAMRTIMW